MSEEKDALEEELGDLPSADEIEAELNGQAAAPAPQAPTTGPGRPQPRPRRRKTSAEGRGGMSETAATVGSPPPVSVEMDEGGDGRKDIFTVWPRILQEQQALGYAPEAIGISVARIATGPMKAPTVQMALITGDLVAGDSSTSPAEMLYDYIVDYYHLESGGPATYRLGFQYRAGGGAIRGSAELPLPAPEQVKRQRDAAERRRYEQAIKTGQIPSGTPFRSGFGMYPAAAPQAAPAAAPGAVSRETLEEIRNLSADAAYLKGKMEAEAAAKAAHPPVPVAAPSRDPRLPPEGLSAEEWDRIQEDRQSRGVGKAVVQALTAMGFTPQTLGALASQTPQPQAGMIPVAAPTSTDPLAGFKAAIDAWKGMAGLKKDIAKALGLELPDGSEGAAKEDDPTRMKPIPGSETVLGAPMAWGEKLEDESWPEFMARWGTHNPAAMEKILGWAAKTFDAATFQKIASAAADALAKRGNRAAPQASAPSQETPKLGWQPT